VVTKARNQDKLERLYHYITSPEVSEKRLSLTAQGKVHHEQKTLYRNGAAHVIFEPLDFIARLVTLVPKPRACLTWFHGVFASIVFFIRHNLLWIGGCTEAFLHYVIALDLLFGDKDASNKSISKRTAVVIYLGHL